MSPIGDTLYSDLCKIETNKLLNTLATGITLGLINGLGLDLWHIIPLPPLRVESTVALSDRQTRASRLAVVNIPDNSQRRLT